MISASTGENASIVRTLFDLFDRNGINNQRGEMNEKNVSDIYDIFMTVVKKIAHSLAWRIIAARSFFVSMVGKIARTTTHFRNSECPVIFGSSSG